MATPPFTRFAITKEGRICSGIWRIYRRKDTIYLHPSNTGGGAKFSLHDGENGRRYRFAVSSDLIIRTVGGDGKRPPITSWDRQDTPNVGVSHALSILFAPQLLRPRDDAVESDVTLLELPQSGRAIQLDVMFSLQDPARMVIAEQQTMLGCTSLSSGENCIVVASVSNFDYEQFRGSARLTWPVDKTVALAALDDPNLSCVLVGEPCGFGLPVIEVSNVVFQNLSSDST
jgi:hypothetical protein